MLGRIHIIDNETRRRAKVAREIMSLGIHAEIYESSEEFFETNPQSGLIFIADDRVDGASTGLLDDVSIMVGANKVIAYSEEISPDNVVSAVQAGALDYLRWPFERERLQAALRKSSADAPPHLKLARLKATALEAVERLSPREAQVLAGLGQGMSNKDIAVALEISPRTVEIHRGNMMTKLNAKAISDAVRIAIYAGLDQAGSMGKLRSAA